MPEGEGHWFIESVIQIPEECQKQVSQHPIPPGFEMKCGAWMDDDGDMTQVIGYIPEAEPFPWTARSLGLPGDFQVSDTGFAKDRRLRLLMPWEEMLERDRKAKEAEG